MTNRDDERYRKAEAAIMAAFTTQLMQVGFTGITVKELISQAGVNRSTFYAHYADKNDLLDYLEDQLIDQLGDLLSSAPVREHASAHIGPTAPVHTYFTQVAEFIQANGTLLTVLLGDKGRPEFTVKLGQMIHQTWSTRHLTAHSKVPVRYAYAVFAGVVVNLITEWVSSGFQENSSEFVAIATHITQDLPGRLFDLDTWTPDPPNVPPR